MLELKPCSGGERNVERGAVAREGVQLLKSAEPSLAFEGRTPSNKKPF